MTEKPSREETTDARRQHIVEVAAGCFIAKGFHQTSIRDIAKAAGVSLGNIYNHFPGKLDLIAEIASLEAAELETFSELFDDPGEPERALRIFVDGYLDMCSAPSHAVLTIEILAEVMREPKIASGFMENWEKLLDKLAGLIGKLRKQGEGSEADEADGYGAGLSPTVAAEFILDLIEGTGFRLVFEGRLASGEDRTNLLTAVRRLAVR